MCQFLQKRKKEKKPLSGACGALVDLMCPPKISVHVGVVFVSEKDNDHDLPSYPRRNRCHHHCCVSAGMSYAAESIARLTAVMSMKLKDLSAPCTL